MTSTRDSKKPEQVIAKWLVVIGIVIVIFGLILWISEYRTKADAKAQEQKVAAEKYAAARQHAPAAPAKINAVTPTELTADYGFFLEADAPIMVQYPGEKPFLFKPGGPCNQLPQPKNSGPKKFWDPKDPKNGHIHFRLYRGSGKC